MPDNEEEYQRLLQEGYDPGYISQLRAMQTTPGEIQEKHFGLMDTREEEAQEEAEKAAYWARVGSTPGLPGGVPGPVAGMAGEALGPLFSTTPSAPPKLEGDVGAHTPTTGGPPSRTYTPSGGEKDDADAAAEAATEVAVGPVEQYDYDTEEYIKRMSGAGVSPDILGRAGVPGTGPAAQMHDPLPGRQVDPSEGKNFRGGQQYAPNRGRGVGDAARRAKERGQTGAFTASRQIPSLEAGWDEVQKTESPMIQRLWQEQKAKELGLESEEAALAQEKGRAGILTAEADEAAIPYEQRIKRHFDALTSAHSDLKERMLPDIQSQIDRRMTLMATDPEMMKLIDTPEKKKAMEAHLAQQLQNETFNKLLGAFYAMMTAQDPGSAGQVMQERERNAMFTGAGAIPGATP